jgi:HlyD family secretion protein
MKKMLILLVVAGLAGGAGYSYWQRSAGQAVSFRVAPVERGDLLITISATGTVEPEEVIDVGAQVAGKIETFGKDPNASDKSIDYGTAVEEGTILANIDDSLYAADVEGASAAVGNANADVGRAKADLEQMKAKLHQAEQNWKRAQELGSSRALSATDYDSYEAAYGTAKATLAVGEATVVQAEKSVVQAEAALSRAKTNLGYCTIRSPVKGVIIDRRVNIGQTVVASLNAPSLFLIAKDLRKMQVWVSVNEADIGSIHPGQPVSFTIDAYPGRTFRGVVGKIRLNASMTQNVVTYTVEVNTDNSDGKLLPYLTANVRFEVTQRTNVLVVPNAALRWTPTPEQTAPDASQEFPGRGSGKSPQQRQPTASGPSGTGTQARGTVWVQDGPFVRPVSVGLGLSDGTMTEIQGDALQEGSEVIIGESERSEQGAVTNPFLPQLFRSRRPG